MTICGLHVGISSVTVSGLKIAMELSMAWQELKQFMRSPNDTRARVVPYILLATFNCRGLNRQAKCYQNIDRGRRGMCAIADVEGLCGI